MFSKDFGISVLGLLVLITAAPTSHADGGAMLYAFEGFDNYAAQSTSLQNAITSALQLIGSLGLDTVNRFPELADLSNQIQFVNYILVPQDVNVPANLSPGDYPVGGFLVASTETYRGAPTKIYPRLVCQLSPSQLVQMVIQEALFRTLPTPLNGSEVVTAQITGILTQYTPSTVADRLRSYLDSAKQMTFPWAVQVVKEGGDASYEQEALQPLFDDGTLIETTATDSRIVIKITVAPSPYVNAGGSFEVDITDNTKQLNYSLGDRIPAGSDSAAVLPEMTDFIRKTFIKIRTQDQEGQ